MVIGSAGEDAQLLLLDVLHQPVDVVGRLDEALQRRDHHRGREVGAGVPVEELGDGLRRLDELGRLLLQCGVAGLVGLVVRRDDARVGLDGDVLRVGGAQVGEQLLRTVLVLGPLGHHVSVDGRFDRVGADGRVDLGEGEEVEVVLFRTLGELLRDEGAQKVHAGLLLLQRLSRLLPGLFDIFATEIKVKAGKTKKRFMKIIQINQE